MLDGDQVNFASRHSFEATVNVITVGAAFDVTYRSFRKRIVNQLVLSRINSISNTVDLPEQHAAIIRIYPNPAQDNFIVAFNQEVVPPNFTYTIFNCMGVVVQHQETVYADQTINVNTLKPGIYYVKIALGDRSEPILCKLVKL